jgi:hypothetical protein
VRFRAAEPHESVYPVTPRAGGPPRPQPLHGRSPGSSPITYGAPRISGGRPPGATSPSTPITPSNPRRSAEHQRPQSSGGLARRRALSRCNRVRIAIADAALARAPGRRDVHGYLSRAVLGAPAGYSFETRRLFLHA